MIHAAPSRMWYVDKYLIPALDGLNYIVWNDDKGLGCLESCMQAFASCEGGATWHLQDDVIPRHDFREQVEELEQSGYGVICGFCHTLFEPFNHPRVGDVPALFSFNSFQCIRIPDEYARECAEWFYTDARHRPEYKNWVDSRKHDDSFWHDFFVERHPHERALNVAPALVEHVDWLIGGSIVNKWRGYICRASYWDDENIIEDLKRELARL